MKTKKISFRIVTALLAVCMMLPLMPSAGNVAAAAGEREKETVAFNTVVKPSGTSWYGAYSDIENMFDTYGWEILSDETSPKVMTNSLTKIMYRGGSAAGVQAMNKDEYATFRFKTPKTLEGYYKVEIGSWLLTNAGFDGELYIDDALVGTFNCDNPDYVGGDTTATAFVETSFDIGTVKISSAETHKLKIVRKTESTGNGSNNIDCDAWISYITFEPTTAPAYYLDIAPESRNYDIYNRDIAKHTWVLNTDLTKGILNYNGIDEKGDPISGWTQFYTISYLRVHLDEGGVFAIDFNLADDAIYDISAEITPYTTAGLIGDVYIDGTFIGAVDCINGTTLKAGTTNNVHPLQQMELNSGKHTLEIRRTDSEVLKEKVNCIYFYGMNFTPVESATEELIPAVFGNAYAFIRETEVAGKTEYKLVLVGAVYSTDLKRVGFCVGNESYSEEATGTTKVYKTINVAGASYTAEDFGLSDDDYIFYREVDVDADDTNLEFYAYAVNTDDSVITGGKRTIAQPVKPQA